jgi:hypothetical protein
METSYFDRDGPDGRFNALNAFYDLHMGFSRTEHMTGHTLIHLI